MQINTKHLFISAIPALIALSCASKFHNGDHAQRDVAGYQMNKRQAYSTVIKTLSGRKLEIEAVRQGSDGWEYMYDKAMLSEVCKSDGRDNFSIAYFRTIGPYVWQVKTVFNSEKKPIQSDVNYSFIADNASAYQVDYNHQFGSFGSMIPRSKVSGVFKYNTQFVSDIREVTIVANGVTKKLSSEDQTQPNPMALQMLMQSVASSEHQSLAAACIEHLKL